MKNLFVLSLDGTPFTFLQKLIAQGLMPNLKKLTAGADFRQMDSVRPPLSSAAWASFATGKNPAQHGIMGFTERDPQTMDWFVPNAKKLRAETLWQKLSYAGKKIFVMNVPLTYPPQQVNGIMISGFLAPALNTATYPQQLGTLLKAKGYIIDADTELAKRDLTAFYKHLNNVFDKRVQTMWSFFEQQEWDFFMTHIMETDRLHHFFWEFMETGHPQYAPMFYDFYKKIDRLIGELLNKLPDDTALMLLSDHGFTTLNKEVYLNCWLKQQGWLQFLTDPAQSLKDMHPQSLAYSLYPGRIYLNVRGREARGRVKPGLEYEKLRDKIRQDLLAWRDENGQPVIKEVLTMNELYGSGSQFSIEQKITEPHPQLPDLIAVAYDGFDLKGNLSCRSLYDKTVFNGMHTFDDAYILAKGFDLPPEKLAITNVFDIIVNPSLT